MSTHRFDPLIVILLVLAFLAAACSGREATTSSTMPARPVPSGSPSLGIAITTATGEEWTEAFARAQKAGATTTELTIFWDEFEVAPGRYEPDLNWLEIANTVYPGSSWPISLTISVVDTTVARLPTDLADRSFDDPEVIERFNSFVTWVGSEIEDTTVTGVSIGNEVDVYLGSTGRWEAYRRFLEATSDHARSVFPEVSISAKVTVDGLLHNYPNEVSALLEDADAYFLTYYHLDEGYRARSPESIESVIIELDETLDERPIYFSEIGYPSAVTLGSSEEAQAEMVRATMEALSARSGHFKGVLWVWLTDLPSETADDYAGYYGVDDSAFVDYLASLGLSRFDGTPKPALEMLREMSGKFGEIDS